MTLTHSAKSLPNKLKSHNFAIFCFFGGTRKIVYAKYTGFFRTRREKHNLIKILTFYGQGTPRDTVYPWGKGAHEQKSEHCRLRRVDNLHNNKYNILNSQAMRNKSSAGCHQERKPFGCKVFWINAGSAVLSLTGGNARACAQTLLRYP